MIHRLLWRNLSSTFHQPEKKLQHVEQQSEALVEVIGAHGGLVGKDGQPKVPNHHEDKACRLQRALLFKRLRPLRALQPRLKLQLLHWRGSHHRHLLRPLQRNDAVELFYPMEKRRM